MIVGKGNFASHLKKARLVEQIGGGNDGGPIGPYILRRIMGFERIIRDATGILYLLPCLSLSILMQKRRNHGIHSRDKSGLGIVYLEHCLRLW